MSGRITIPLFPLKTVLFPGGVLPLRIFEPRYLDMIADCLRHDTGIGVVLIRDGSEVGGVPAIHELGTLSRIHYWHKRSDGLLGVTLRGESRFRILETEVRPDRLMLAEVERLPEVASRPVTDDHARLVSLLRQIIDQLEPPFTTMTPHWDDAAWVGGRLAELLPLDLPDKQALLAEDDVLARLETIARQLTELELE